MARDPVIAPDRPAPVAGDPDMAGTGADDDDLRNERGRADPGAGDDAVGRHENDDSHEN
jgi:hypothetical protein